MKQIVAFLLIVLIAIIAMVNTIPYGEIFFCE